MSGGRRVGFLVANVVGTVRTNLSDSVRLPVWTSPNICANMCVHVAKKATSSWIGCLEGG